MALAVILTVIIVMAVYRRRRPAFGDKDIDCDIRENIINYEDEGGGEGDQTGYDLSVLRMTPDGKPLIGKNDDYGTLLHKVTNATATATATATAIYQTSKTLKNENQNKKQH